MKDIIRVIKYAKPYLKYGGLSLLANIFFIFFSFFSLTIIAPFLSLLFGLEEPVMQRPEFSFNVNIILQWLYYYITKIQLSYGSIGALVFISILFLVSSFFSNLFRYLGMFFFANVQNGSVKEVRNRLYEKILRLPLSYFSNQKRGDLIARMSEETNHIEYYIFNPLLSLVKEPINILVFLSALLAINAKMVLFVVLIMPPAIFIIGKVGKSLKRNSDKGQKQMGVILSSIEETISGMRVIKSFNMFDYVISKFDKIQSGYTRYMNKVYRKKDLADPMTEFLVALAAVFVIWYGGNLVLSAQLNPEAGGSMDATTLILFIVLFFRLIPSTKSLVNAVFHIQKGRSSLQRIYEILDADEKIFEAENAQNKKEFTKNITFDHVFFDYSEDPNKKVLDDINLVIEKGKMIAIVGPSGSGKTTLANLIPRFYDCSHGSIRIDDVPIKEIKIEDLRGLSAIVSQHCILFNDTIYNNIVMGRENITREMVIEAAKIANADEFIDALPEKYDTNIGDSGVKLSGGQRQRISIARAVLKNAPILILDEATSALDNKSEKVIQEALNNIMKTHTSVVIAHRMSTIQYADIIMVMNEGKIVERGTHSELMEKDGLYKSLVNMQTFH